MCLLTVNIFKMITFLSIFLHSNFFFFLVKVLGGLGGAGANVTLVKSFLAPQGSILGHFFLIFRLPYIT